jgi:hypothetical protein
MAEAEQQQHVPGGHYSGANPVPTIKKFVENLDRGKKERDRQLDEAEKMKTQGVSDDLTPHKNQLTAKRGQKIVTDPTTGREVVIEDVGKDMMNAAKDPKVFSFFVLIQLLS